MIAIAKSIFIAQTFELIVLLTGLAEVRRTHKNQACEVLYETSISIQKVFRNM